ncbi:uncharacterized protein FIBRA_09098 [Fibroporia radiculosa]|uniref:Helicase C-terminal domain-containing protein n=1 Tax=Fibroporia radiculosa TaxID=599839 RepID=J4GIW0_9APHY|nr:uncharacterized protein FIBRA_09098 [Fibroporia radiculosa]CCM06798.1 predicted protein [Fibroporia radiculosa]
MPSMPIVGALLELFQEKPAIWTWPTWQGITNLSGPPYAQPAVDHKPSDWSDEVYESVNAFIHNFHMQESTNARHAYITTGKLVKTKKGKSAVTRDNNSQGRKVWIDWVGARWSEWKLNDVIDATLTEDGFSLTKIMKLTNTRELPSLDRSQVSSQYGAVADALFGEEVWVMDSHVNPDAHLFVTQVMACVWNRYRKAINWKAKGLDKRIERAERMWKELPKAIRDALQHPASENKIVILTGDLIKMIRGEADRAKGVLQIELEDALPLNNWESGTEAFQEWDTMKVMGVLGILADGMPFFNKKEHPGGALDPWTAEGQKVAASPDVVPLEPRWHQYVGMLQMAQRMMDGKPTLQMDEVGVGKTMQAIGLIALRAYYREYFVQHEQFPGMFVNCCCVTKDGNLTNKPPIFVVLVNLFAQVQAEMHHYLEKDAFDLFMYAGSVDTQQQFWTDKVFGRSKHALHHRIILATSTAVQSDADKCFATKKDKWVAPSTGAKSRRWAPKTVYGHKFGLCVIDESRRWAPKTVYGREFGLCVIDEAHLGRTMNKLFTASMCLGERSRAVVAMTATPVLTKPGDLSRRINSARRRDMHRLKDTFEENYQEVLDMLLKNTQVASNPKSEYHVEIMKALADIREKFKGAIVRRTVNSLDYMGSQISGLADYQEHKLLEYVTGLTKDLISEGGREAVFQMGKSFYLGIRRSLTHIGCYDASWEAPTNAEEAEKEISTKIKAVLEILEYHLKEDGLPPLLTPESEPVLENVLAPAPNAVKEPRGEGAALDKIIVFVAFPANLEVILPFFEFCNITWIEVTGNVTMSQWAKRIQQFKDSGYADLCVLIFSGIGLVGLNLVCTNILIMMDTLWSAQEDSQLIGRVWRHPQPKQVHVYRLIAWNTPDMFLNRISFDKATMMKAFTGMPGPMRNLFGQESDAADVLDDSTSNIEEIPEPKRKKNTGATKSNTGRKGKKSALIVMDNEDEAGPSRTSSAAPACPVPAPCPHKGPLAQDLAPSLPALTPIVPTAPSAPVPAPRQARPSTQAGPSVTPTAPFHLDLAADVVMRHGDWSGMSSLVDESSKSDTSSSAGQQLPTNDEARMPDLAGMQNLGLQNLGLQSVDPMTEDLELLTPPLGTPPAVKGPNNWGSGVQLLNGYWD